MLAYSLIPDSKLIEPLMTTELLEDALTFRAAFFDERHQTAFRLFNGFTEGNPDLVIDLYARALVIHNYADKPEQGFAAVREAQRWLPARFPCIQSCVVE